MDSVIQSAGGTSSAGAPTRTARPVSVIGEQPSWWGNRTGRYFGANVLHSIQIVRYKNSMSLLSNVCRYIAAGVLSKCVLKKMDCCIDPVVYTRVAALQDWVRLKAPGVRDSKGCPKQIEVGEYWVPSHLGTSTKLHLVCFSLWLRQWQHVWSSKAVC